MISSRWKCVGRALRVFGATIFTDAVGASDSWAADITITARESVVRSAPLEVAPVLARVHAGQTLSSDEAPFGIWRRVKLQDGRLGFIREADAQMIPGAPVAADSGSAVAATPAGPRAAKVAVLELVVRATPSTNAPILKVFHQNDSVPVFPDLDQSWRRVDLGSGESGFALDAGLTLVGAAPPTVTARSDSADGASGCAGAPAQEVSSRTHLGLLFEAMPLGTITSTTSPSTISTATTSAGALAPFLDVAISPYLTLGVSPQIIFGVRAISASESATEYDLRARLTAVSPELYGARAYARFSPGYSIISPNSSSNASNQEEFILDFAIGTELSMSPKLSIVFDVGFQTGLPSMTAVDGTGVDVKTRFAHFGIGFAFGL